MAESFRFFRQIFINDEQELRSGWRVAVFVLLFLFFSNVISAAVAMAGMFYPPLGELVSTAASAQLITRTAVVANGIIRLVLLAAAFAATAVCTRFLERRSFGSAGYRLHRGCSRDFALGSLIGLLTLTLAVSLSWSVGAMSFQMANTAPSSLAQVFVLLFAFFLVAAAFEELLFRGFPFQALMHNLGATWALMITSVGFGLLHLGNPNATVLGTMNTMLAGVWLGVGYLITRSLWLPTALHYSWNLAMVFIFGLPVSGVRSGPEMTWLAGRGEPPSWLSGGEYGPEGGIAATVALLVSTVIMWRGRLFRPSAEMLESVKHGSRAGAWPMDQKEHLR